MPGNEKKMADHYERAYNTAANTLIRAAMTLKGITQEHGGDGAIVIQNNYITVHISHREPHTQFDGNIIRIEAG